MNFESINEKLTVELSQLTKENYVASAVLYTVLYVLRGPESPAANSGFPEGTELYACKYVDASSNIQFGWFAYGNLVHYDSKVKDWIELPVLVDYDNR